MPLHPEIFSSKDIKIEKREVVFKGFFRMEELSLSHKTFDGKWIGPFSRELFVRGEAVCVLLFDPKRDKVILTEQIRIGALEDERSPWLLELVAGIVEPNETQEEVALRESQEEAGCIPSQLIPICRYWVSPGGCNERISLYCGIIDSDGVGGIHGLPHEHEDIRLTTLTFDEAYQLVEEGVINNAASIIALQWLKIHHTTISNDS